MIAKGIITLEDEDKSKLGTDKLTQNDLFVTLPHGIDSDGVLLTVYIITKSYDGMKLTKQYHAIFFYSMFIPIGRHDLLVLFKPQVV